MIEITPSTKVWLFILFSSLSILILGYQLGERQGLMLGFLISALFNLLIFIYGDFKLQNSFECSELQGHDPYGINQILDENLSLLKLPTRPKIKVFHSQAVNAFTLGLFWNQPVIFLSSGLVQKLCHQEIKSVIILCLSQIQRMDTFAFGVTSIFANTLLGLAQKLEYLLFFKYFHSRLKNFKPFTFIFKSFCWILIKSIASSDTYYKNDSMCASVIGNKRDLCELLWKLNGYSQTIPLKVPAGTNHLFLVPPDQRESAFFNKIQPDINQRIVKLIGHSPL